MNGIVYPVEVKDVPKFGKQNNISVNVFGCEEGYYPLYISRNQKEKHVNLLLIEKGGKTHYCLITDLNKMLHSPPQKNIKHFTAPIVYMDSSGKICLTNTNHCVKNMAHNAQNYPVEKINS